MELERCSECDQPTGKAGRGDDSIFVIRDCKELGPLCEECRSKLWVCDKCDCVVPDNQVTFQERHDECGGACS